MSTTWNKICNDSRDINRGGIKTDGWWKDVYVCNNYSCASIKLQEHTGGTKGVIGFARSVGWWSNHNDKYRIIWKRKTYSKWKELYHCDNLNVMKRRYNDYVKVIQWRQETFY